MRMLMNNLPPDVAEDPHALVVYGGIGRAARTWEDFDKIVASLQDLESDESLLVQSGKPVGVVSRRAGLSPSLRVNSWDLSASLDIKPPGCRCQFSP